MENGPGVSELFDVIDAGFVLGRRVAGESFRDSEADELGVDCDDQLCALPCLKSFKRRAICGLYLYDSESHRGTHSFEFGELGHEWVKDSDEAHRECLRDLDNAWGLSTE